MRGLARRESSQVLCIEIVLRPPMKISEVYSSKARLESPTYGTYFITTYDERTVKYIALQLDSDAAAVMVVSDASASNINTS